MGTTISHIYEVLNELQMVVDMDANESEKTVDFAVTEGNSLGTFRLTYYWISQESEYVGPRNTPLYGTNGRALTNARPDFVSAVSTEGTGILEDGRMINLFGPCRAGTCFFYIDQSKFPYGMGSEGNPLHPFKTVAADSNVFEHGTRLYIKELDGVSFTGVNGSEDFVHDGCVVVEDTGVQGKHLDFFAMTRKNYETIDNILGQREAIEVYTNVAKCMQ